MSGWIGIDPGKTGAAAFISTDGEVCIWDYNDRMPDTLLAIKDHAVVKLWVIEAQGFVRGQGGTSAFTLGCNFGGYCWALRILGVPFRQVRPQRWQKDLGIPPKKEKAARKKAIANWVLDLYPDAEVTGPKGGLKDGRTDALAIAHWAKLNS